jgi:hypothetical protein
MPRPLWLQLPSTSRSKVRTSPMTAGSAAGGQACDSSSGIVSLPR